MANMASGRLDKLVFAIHNRLPPSEEEWSAYLALCETAKREAADGSLVYGLTVTDGGAPNAIQRNRFRGILEGGRVKAAMITDSVVVRGLVSFFSLFVDGLRPFTPGDWRAALAHLDLPSEREEAVRAELARLSARVGGVQALEPLLSKKP